MFINQEQWLETPAVDQLTKWGKEFSFQPQDTISDVEEKISRLLAVCKEYKDTSKVLLSRTYYPNEQGGVAYVRFVIRPSVRNDIPHVNLRQVFTVQAGEGFYVELLQQLMEWLETYRYRQLLQVNVELLNQAISEIVRANRVPFDLAFAQKDSGGRYPSTEWDPSEKASIVAITDHQLTLGLPDGLIERLADLPLFAPSFDERQAYGEEVAKSLLEAPVCFHLLKVKTAFTLDLGIYTRSSVITLIRKIVSREHTSLRVGTGYIATAEYFAVIERIAVTEEESLSFTPSERLLIEPNHTPIRSEVEKNQTYIVTKYVVSPFHRQTNERVRIPLEELLILGR